MVEVSWPLFVVAPLALIVTPGAVSYFAFLPQFVSPSAQHPTLSVFVLGIAFAALTFLVEGPVGVFAGTLSRWVRSRPGVLTWVYRSTGAIVAGLGVKLALEQRQGPPEAARGGRACATESYAEAARESWRRAGVDRVRVAGSQKDHASQQTAHTGPTCYRLDSSSP